MLKLVVLSFLIAYVYAAWYEEQAEYWIKKTNSKNLPWKAAYSKYFAGKSEAEIKHMMGTKMDRRGLAEAPKVYHNYADKANLPTSFIAGKDKWPNCASTINFIKDQASCGSCWAVAASEVVADRMCIANGGAHLPADKLNEARPGIDMSAEIIMSCCSYCGNGCEGGYPIDAMKFWFSNGVCTGGWYGSNCGCQPYMISPTGPANPPTPACSGSCRSGYNKQLSADLHKAKSYYQIQGSAAAIQQEIYNNGPVECAFDVYGNFMTYHRGIYNQTDGPFMGGHAIKIIGWGVQDGTDYWVINNSWNVTWGMNGQLWFLRGVNLAGMESQCVAGLAKAPDNNYMLQCS